MSSRAASPVLDVVVVGESTAGAAATRELRSRGYAGSLTVIGADPDGLYNRPALSKSGLAGEEAEGPVDDSFPGLSVTVHRSAATGLDVDGRTVHTADGRAWGYDRLIIATGARARRQGSTYGTGPEELVLRDRRDARTLGRRLSEVESALIVGGGFLGMEVATACRARGLSTTVVDLDPPLDGLLGGWLSERLRERAVRAGARLVHSRGPVELAEQSGSVRWRDGSTMSADCVVSCVGDVPAVGWLSGSGLLEDGRLLVDSRCETVVDGVYAVGDVAFVRGPDAPLRRPFWSNAVTQGRRAAAAAVGADGTDGELPPLWDDYFWTELFGVSIKVVGPLGLTGPPEVLEGSVANLDGGPTQEKPGALLRWTDDRGAHTVVSLGRRTAVGRLRAIARDQG